MSEQELLVNPYGPFFFAGKYDLYLGNTIKAKLFSFQIFVYNVESLLQREIKHIFN